MLRTGPLAHSWCDWQAVQTVWENSEDKNTCEQAILLEGYEDQGPGRWRSLKKFFLYKPKGLPASMTKSGLACQEPTVGNRRQTHPQAMGEGEL